MTDMATAGQLTHRWRSHKGIYKCERCGKRANKNRGFLPATACHEPPEVQRVLTLEERFEELERRVEALEAAPFQQ